MKLKIKKLSDKAVIPQYAYAGDAGLDIVATNKSYQEGFVSYGTDLAFEIPSGHVGLLFPRSSISNKDQMLSNSVGVIDSGFRGEVTFRFKDTDPTINKALAREYEIGDKIGQLLIVQLPKVDIVEVSELSESNRSTKAYGSSGD